MQNNFCTLFDQNYLTRGLALYDSLNKHCQSFKLWVLCMDETTYDVLERLNLPNAILIKLSDFEDKQLLAVKPTRTAGEYCWTCTPSLPLYIFAHYKNVKQIAYLDADIYFYSSPNPIFCEFKGNSIMIIPHRYSPSQKHMEGPSGAYNVSMLVFKRDANGLKSLNWWRGRCLEWCYNRVEDGKLGDQKYLEQFPKLFKKVHILDHIGAGVAPWNISQYKILEKDNRVYLNGVPLIFYHFQGLKIYSPLFNLPPVQPWSFGEKTPYKYLVYDKYFATLYRKATQVRKFLPGFASGFYPRPKINVYLKEIAFNYRLEIEYALKRFQLPKYLKFFNDYRNFKNQNDQRFKLSRKNFWARLNDNTDITTFDKHYLYHPAWAARVLARTNPQKHVDISSILSFSATVSAFIPIEFYDLRPANISLDGLRVAKADLTNLPFVSNSIKSLSCMHTLEHIGLGRYGDPINPKGDLTAMRELKRVLAQDGNLLIVVPIGKSKLMFNAHRIYSYDQIIKYFSGLKLVEFSLISGDDKTGIITNASKDIANQQNYGCGCFWFTKV